MAILLKVGKQRVTDLRTTFELADPALNADLTPGATRALVIIREGPVGSGWRGIAVMPPIDAGPGWLPARYP